jgi:hypothetical protein
MRVTDVERLKKEVRKMAASRVLGGEPADVGLDLGRLHGCRACIKAGYRQLSKEPQVMERDRLIWVLDGYVDIHQGQDRVTTVSQGESAVLAGGSAYRLVFPQLALYLSLEAEDGA